MADSWPGEIEVRNGNRFSLSRAFGTVTHVIQCICSEIQIAFYFSRIKRLFIANEGRIVDGIKYLFHAGFIVKGGDLDLRFAGSVLLAAGNETLSNQFLHHYRRGFIHAESERLFFLPVTRKIQGIIGQRMFTLLKDTRIDRQLVIAPDSAVDPVHDPLHSHPFIFRLQQDL